MTKVNQIEPIAIIGMGCRFPGAPDLGSYWQLLRNGIDATTPVPADRWNADAMYDADPSTPGRINSTRGGFIADLDRFDAQFFGIYPREARRMDVQQKLTLEVAWEALEYAGIAPSSLAGSPVGVYMGVSHSDHGRKLHADIPSMDGQEGTNYYHGFVSHRLSYLLNLQGPSMGVDTACSSALVAIHLACQALRDGECDLALSGGVNVNLLPGETISASIAGMLSSQGRCNTFDRNADGFVRGEGCGVLVLKRLRDAVQQGDNVLAVIRGSAVNHNGMSNGITAPNGRAQQMLIQRALAVAGVEPWQISYVEAHGTGSVQGDAIEVRALQQVLNRGRGAEQPCRIGAVKTNIGHLEAASGVAGVIKTVLSLQHCALPPVLHLQDLNPHISLYDSPFSIPTTLEPWDTPAGELRLAGVSAFGFGGTNCHLVLQEAPAVAKPEATDVERPLHVMVLRAKSETALRAMAGRYSDCIRHAEHAGLADLCYSANTGRNEAKYRLALVADTSAQLCEQLSAYTAQAMGDEIRSMKCNGRHRPKVAFQFSSEHPDLAVVAMLYRTAPVFRQIFNQCDRVWQCHLQRSLSDGLHGTSLADEDADADYLWCAYQLAMAHLWSAWGVKPTALLADGKALLAAACFASVLDKASVGKVLDARRHLRSVTGTITMCKPRYPIFSGASCASMTEWVADARYWDAFARPAEPASSAPAPAQTVEGQDLWCLQFAGDCVALAAPGSSEHIASAPIWHSLTNALCRLYMAGAPIDWKGFDREYARRRIALPTYPFERKAHWFNEPGIAADAALSNQLTTALQSSAALAHAARKLAWFDAIVVTLQEGRAERPPLFVIHPVGGSIFCYQHLAVQLGPDQPVYGLQAPALAGVDANFVSLEAMATTYLACIRHMQPTGELHLAGWSMGGAVAFEMAQQLRRNGERPALLALVDTHLPSADWIDSNARSLLLTMALDLGIGLEALDQDWLQRAELAPGLHYVLDLAVRTGILPDRIEEDEFTRRLGILQHHLRVFRRYRPQRYEEALIVFKAAQKIGEGEHLAEDLGWRHVADAVELHELPGHHFSVLREPHVRVLASHLRHRLFADAVAPSTLTTTCLTNACADILLNGAEGLQPRAAGDIEAWALQWLSARIEIEAAAIDPEREFTHFGINSITAVRFLKDIGCWLGMALEPMVIWKFRTVRALAAHLAARSTAPAAVEQEDVNEPLAEVLEGTL